MAATFFIADFSLDVFLFHARFTPEDDSDKADLTKMEDILTIVNDCIRELTEISAVK